MLKDILLLIKVILLWSKFMSAIMYGLFRDIPMTTLLVYFFSSAEGWSDTVCCCSGNNGKHSKGDIRVTCHSAEAFLSKPQELSLWNNLPISASLKCTMEIGQNCDHIKSLSKWIWIYNPCANGKGPRLEYQHLSDWTWTQNFGIAKPYNPCTLINHSMKSNFCHCALTFILSQICDIFSLVDTIVEAIASFK